MRRLACLALVTAAATLMVASPTFAQTGRQGGPRDQTGGQQQGNTPPANSEWNQTAPPLPALRNAGPCPFVKVLYDAARAVEFADAQEAAAGVTYSGEINGLTATCEYRDAQPITVRVRLDMAFGRGPRATSNQRTYRYWVAVTQRNQAVLAKEYFDVPVTFAPGQDRVGIDQTLGDIVIPRANIGVSGANFEVLIGFDVTPQQATFNREGRRFFINAGQAAAVASSPPRP